jgi:hypothetical protein
LSSDRQEKKRRIPETMKNRSKKREKGIRSSGAAVLAPEIKSHAVAAQGLIRAVRASTSSTKIRSLW